MEQIFFFFLGLFLCFSIVGIYATSNPVYSIISLVWSIILSSLLLFFLGEEFIGFMLLVVYVGAVAVLFLFVVMLLGTRLADASWTVLPIWFNVFFMVLSGLTLIFFEGSTPFVSMELCNILSGNYDYLYVNDFFFFNDLNNLIVLAYEVVSSPLLVLGSLILLVAMLAAISLTTWR